MGKRKHLEIKTTYLFNIKKFITLLYFGTKLIFISRILG